MKKWISVVLLFLFAGQPVAFSQQEVWYTFQINTGTAVDKQTGGQSYTLQASRVPATQDDLSFDRPGKYVVVLLKNEYPVSGKRFRYRLDETVPHDASIQVAYKLKTRTFPDKARLFYGSELLQEIEIEKPEDLNKLDTRQPISMGTPI